MLRARIKPFLGTIGGLRGKTLDRLPALPKSNLFVRPQLRAASSFADQKVLTVNRDGTASVETRSNVAKHSPPMDFRSGESALRAQSSVALIRCWLVLQLCTIRPLVKNAEALVKLSYRVFGTTITNTVMKNTFFAHFCAGETEEGIRPRVDFLEANGVGSILDYAAEADLEEEKTESNSGNVSFSVGRVYTYESEKQCDEYLAIFTKCVVAVRNVSPSGFAAIKLTALGNPALLQRISTAIIEVGNLFRNFDRDGSGTISRSEFKEAFDKYFHTVNKKIVDEIFDNFSDGDDAIDYIDWTSQLRLEDLDDLLGMCRSQGPLSHAALDDEERALYSKLKERVFLLATAAEEQGVRLMIDAEQSYFQPAIDSMVADLQAQFNKDRPIIFNTFQCYLTDSHERMQKEIENARRFNYKFGAKLVRGAYMVSERQRAKELGVPSPVFANLKQTHANYNRALVDVLREIQAGRGANVMVASHNQQSVEIAVETMKEFDIDPKDGGVYFGQLLGMSDNLTFTLGQNGYNAYKYVPFGMVQEVMPYLIRRAYENSDVFGSVQFEQKMVGDELLRRLGKPTTKAQNR